MNLDRPFLCVSDTQIPFEAPRALEFVQYIKRHYSIPDENMMHVGDELDAYHGGRWPKDPNGQYSAVGELAESKRRLKEWYKAFPLMMLAISNHGLRWVRKASAAEIPSQMLRSYQEIIEAPPGWSWKLEWAVPTKHPFRVIHGLGYSSINSQRNAALDAGISTVHGHLIHAGISHVVTANQKLWGMCVGALIDPEAYAFEYGKEHRFKASLGVGVVAGKGSTPIWLPYE